MRYKRILKLYRELMVLEVMNYIVTTSRNKPSRQPEEHYERSVNPDVQESSTTSQSDVESVDIGDRVPTTIYHTGSQDSAVSYLVIDEQSVAASLSMVGSRDGVGIAPSSSRVSMGNNSIAGSRQSRYSARKASNGGIEVSLVDSRDCVDNIDLGGSFERGRDGTTEPKILTPDQVKEMQRVVENTLEMHASKESGSVKSGKNSVDNARQKDLESQSGVFQMLSSVQKEQLNEIVTNVFDKYMYEAPAKF